MLGRSDPKIEVIRDRRSAPRLTFAFPVVLRDASFAWKAQVENISSSGCLLRLANQLPIGKQLEVELKPQGRPATRVKGEIVHLQAGGLAGFRFFVDKSEDYEKTVDLFEWLLAQQPGLAVEVQKRPVMLAKATVLWPLPDNEVTPRPEEARFMTLFVGGRSLAEVEKLVGPRFEKMMYLAFSMLDRKLLTLVQPGQYVRPDENTRISAPPQPRRK